MSKTADIVTARERWTAALNAGSADAFADCVTQDAVWLPPRGGALEGASALAEWLRPLFDQFQYEFSTSDEQIRLVGGRWAVENGVFLSVLRSRSGDNAPMIHQGKYTILWRGTDAGGWRIDRYIDQSD